MLDTVVMSGDDVCCSVVFGTLVGVFVFSVMWSELLMTSAISCPLWSSVYECQRVECAFTSPVRTECGMFVMYCTVCSVVCPPPYSAHTSQQQKSLPNYKHYTTQYTAFQNNTPHINPSYPSLTQTKKFTPYIHI